MSTQSPRPAAIWKPLRSSSSLAVRGVAGRAASTGVSLQSVGGHENELLFIYSQLITETFHAAHSLKHKAVRTHKHDEQVSVVFTS